MTGPKTNNVRRLLPGSPAPLGAHWDGKGVNFALFSGNATGVDLCLFDSPDSSVESHQLPMTGHTGQIWHGYLPGAGPGLTYGYRVDGPYAPEHGHRFNPHKLLLDPYARAITGELDWQGPVYGFQTAPRFNDLVPDDRDSASSVPRSLVIDPGFDWGDDRPPAIPWERTVIYEVHVKGFTRALPGVAPNVRGSYLGLADPAAIDHLVNLGVTAVELLPVHASLDEAFLVGLGLCNYWGYNSIGFFAPEARLASNSNPGAAVTEFKTMVAALHAAGIEVILDVVYNHTAEGNHLGPTLCFRGIDNATYYRLAREQPRYYVDFTGTGNTTDLRQPPVLRLVMDSLRYWVEEMHVDGFRFDLAPALARELDEFDRFSSFFNTIQQDPVLSRVKLIAEPWDAGAGGYQIGNFPTGWTEWNGKFRDTVRAFWRGDGQPLSELGSRLTGSADLYQDDGRSPMASINFVTAHDGFTLEDLVSYAEKHNEANGENNRDGSNDNLSANYGVEGPTERADVLAVRERQKRNLLLTLFCAQGVPMLLGGDELGRTQGGNNNAYCQNNDVSWFNWKLSAADTDMLEFTRRLLAIRAAHPVLRRPRFFDGLNKQNGERDLIWLRAGGGEMNEPDWSAPGGLALGCCLVGSNLSELDERGESVRDDTLALLLNAGPGPTCFDLPAPDEAGDWQILIDTGAPLDPGRRTLPPGNTQILPRTGLLLCWQPSALDQVKSE